MCYTVSPCWLSILNTAVCTCLGFPGGSVVKNPPVNAGDAGDVDLITGLGRSLGWEDPLGGNGSPPQYSYLENPMVRRVWWAIVHGVAKSQT